MIRNLIILFAGLVFGSCGSTKMLNRQSFKIDSSIDFKKSLVGKYRIDSSNVNGVQNPFRSELWKADLELTENHSLEVKIVDKNTLQFDLIKGGDLVDSLIVKGKFKKGYFAVRPTHGTDFMAGPLFWNWTICNKCVGLTKEKELIITGRCSGTLFVVLFPMMAANGGISTMKMLREF